MVGWEKRKRWRGKKGGMGKKRKKGGVAKKKKVEWEKRWGGKRHLWFAAAVDRDTTLTNAALSPGTQGSADSV